jgi:hypothetical protein
MPGSMNQKAWDAGYADGLARRPHGTDPLHKVDSSAYSAGYIEGQSAAGKGWIPDEPRDAAGNPLPEADPFSEPRDPHGVRN